MNWAQILTWAAGIAAVGFIAVFVGAAAFGFIRGLCNTLPQAIKERDWLKLSFTSMFTLAIPTFISLFVGEIWFFGTLFALALAATCFFGFKEYQPLPPSARAKGEPGESGKYPDDTWMDGGSDGGA